MPRQIVQLDRLFDTETVDLACHASLPVALTPDLLHAIRVNFFLDVERPVPFWAEARLLLSPLCHAIGDGLYQIDPPVRDELLRRLTTRHGEGRLRALAELLLQFGEHGTPWADRPELDSAQRLSALAVLEPEAARAWLGDPSARPRGQELDEAWFVAMRGQIEGRPADTLVAEARSTDPNAPLEAETQALLAAEQLEMAKGQYLGDLVATLVVAARTTLMHGALSDASALAESAVRTARQDLRRETERPGGSLNSVERREMHQALIRAFPTAGQLDMLLSTAFDVSLDAITAPGTLNARVDELLRWAEAHDRVLDLASAARRARPGNTLLTNVVEGLEHRGPGARRDSGRSGGDGTQTATDRLIDALEVSGSIQEALGESAVAAAFFHEARALAPAEPDRLVDEAPMSVEEGLRATVRRTGQKSQDDTLVGLAREYDDIRARMPFNDERTQRLEGVRARIQAAGPPSPVLQSRLRSSRSAGERLVLVCALEKAPDEEMLAWLADRFAGEQPFLQYWAALALRRAALELPVDQLDATTAAIERASASVWDAPAKEVLSRAATVVRERRRRKKDQPAPAVDADEQRLAEPIVTDWKLWPAGSRILVKFLDGSAALRARVFGLAQEWATLANIQFRLVTGAESHIRISFLGDGSWSALGTEALDRERYPLDKPTMNYGWLTDGLPDADVRHVVLHEFGTALGLINEHQSPNCPLTWNVPEIVRDLTGPPNNFTREATIDLFRKYQFTGPPDYRAFDPTSVMMWPLASSWTQDGQSFAQTPTLSASDRQFIARLYPKGVSA